MSWSSIIETNCDNFAGDIARIKPDMSDGDFDLQEAKDQLEYGRRVAKTLLEKGVVGTTGRVRVILTGHANSGHEQPERLKDADRAPDRVVVCLERVDYREVNDG